MKREMMMGFVFVLLSISFAVAAPACGGPNDDQLIMRLYSGSNSHVSAWDQLAGYYTEEICYNDIFGFEYDGTDPHTCNAFNRVLSLYNSNNSHASQANDPVNYNYDVCFGDLSCVYDSSSGDSCSNDGEIIAKMYSSNNSHVANASDSNYDIKICCAPTALLYWADMSGNEITSAEYQDTVQLVARGVSSGNFNISEEDDGPVDFFDDDIKTVTNGESVGFNWVGTWTVADEDLLITRNDYDDFYFEIDGEKSDHLAIDPEGEDDPMSVSILSPLCGEYFNESQTVEIVVVAVDPDDVISGTIKINGFEESFTNGGITFEYTFSDPGNVQVVLEASNTRGESSRMISNVMILDMEGANYVNGDYVAACIDKPKDFINIPGSTVEFDASTTRGVRVSSGVVDELVPSEGDVFSWYWRFFGPNGEYPSRSVEDTTDELAYIFTKEFPVAGQNSASLTVEV